MRDGNWHPFPGCVIDSLEVSLNGYELDNNIIHTADRISESNKTIVLNWDTPPPLPLFVPSQDQKLSEYGESQFLIADSRISENEIERLYGVYSEIVTQLKQRVLQNNQTNDSLQIALIPMTKYGRYDLLSNTIFLPEKDSVIYNFQSDIKRFQDYQNSSELNNPDSFYSRWIAERMIRMWWCGLDFCPDIQVKRYDISALTTKRMFDDSDPDVKPVLNSLLSYSALQLAEPLVGSEFLVEEIEHRRLLVEAQDEFPFRPIAFGYYSNINELMVRLDGLWETIGEDAYWDMVNTYRDSYGDTSISLYDFEKFIKQETGVDLP